MNRKLLDFLLSVLLPLVLGIGIYLYPLHAYIRNYLPDGLWAYAFVSTFLIIWNRQLHYFWLSICCFCFVLYEVLQYLNYLEGTGDPIDLLVYAVFMLLALFTNTIIKLKPTNS